MKKCIVVKHLGREEVAADGACSQSPPLKRLCQDVQVSSQETGNWGGSFYYFFPPPSKFSVKPLPCFSRCFCFMTPVPAFSPACCCCFVSGTKKGSFVFPISLPAAFFNTIASCQPTGLLIAQQGTASTGWKLLGQGQDTCFPLATEGFFLFNPVSVFHFVRGAMSSCAIAATVETEERNRRYVLVPGFRPQDNNQKRWE